MTGKAYYLTTLSNWQRCAARFTNSHWIALDSGDSANCPSGAPSAQPRNAAPVVPGAAKDLSGDPSLETSGATRILVLVEADEGAHLALEDDPTFEPLPHPLSRQAASAAAQAALALIGAAAGATTFEVAEIAARIHPLLRHRVF